MHIAGTLEATNRPQGEKGNIYQNHKYLCCSDGHSQASMRQVYKQAFLPI